MDMFAILLGTLFLWIVLNRWVLPWFGIRTCMSGGCGVDSCDPCGSAPSKCKRHDDAGPPGDQS
jgi:hypothetical protein